MSRTLWIGHISKQTTEEELQQEMNKHGEATVNVRALLLICTSSTCNLLDVLWKFIADIQCQSQIFDTACIVCGRVYVTIRCLSVCPIVCHSCGMGREMSINSGRWWAPSSSGTTAQHSAVNASSVTFVADAGGSTQTCHVTLSLLCL